MLNTSPEIDKTTQTKKSRHTKMTSFAENAQRLFAMYWAE